MKKSHLFIAVLLFTASTIYFYSCKKSDVKNPGSQEALVEKINSWLESKKLPDQPVNSKKIQQLKESLNFSGLRFEPFKEGEQFLIIPVKESFKSVTNADKNPVTNLLLILNKSGNVRRGNIVQYIPSDRQRAATVPEGSFYKIFTSQKLESDGQFVFLGITDWLLYELKYENGNLRSVGVRSSKNVGDNKANRSFCLEWWLTTTLYYDDGSTEVYETYLGITCYGDGQPEVPQGDEGGGGSEDQCLLQCITDFNALVSNTTTVSQTIATNVSNIDGLTKNKNPSWRILKNLTWSLYSHETGTIEHVSYPEDRWEWRTLTHQSITMEGTPIGGSVTYSQGVGTPSFTPGTPNVLYAGMSISFTVTYAPACNCPGINILFPPTTRAYTSNAIWDANPI